MKKLIGMIMAIAMTFALATTAFAVQSPVTISSDTVKEDEHNMKYNENGNTIGIDIPANFVAGANDPYKVEANYYVIVKYKHIDQHSPLPAKNLTREGCCGKRAELSQNLPSHEKREDEPYGADNEKEERGPPGGRGL